MATSATAPLPVSDNRWKRAGLIFLFVLALKVALSLILLCGLFQFVSVLVTGRSSTRIARFGQANAEYVREVSLFVSCRTAVAPWPLADFPTATQSIDS